MDEEPFIKDDDLKPCPFCGGEADVSKGSKGPDSLPWWYVECGNCAAMCDSVEDWNKRTAPAEVQTTYHPEIIIRTNADASLDEAILKDGKAHFHLEQMSATHWWMALVLDKQSVHINLHSKAAIKANLSDEGEISLLDGPNSGGKP